MTYREHRPPLAHLDARLIASTVDAFWSTVATGEPYRVLPDGCMDLLFDLSSERATVIGAMTEAIVVAAPPGRHVFGVRFRPGRASLFVDAIAGELRDQRVSLDALVGRSADALVEQVLAAKSDVERASVVAAFVHEPRSRVRANDVRVDRAARCLERSHGRVAIARVANEVGLSERQLERTFHERVGVGPKLFARVQRMQHAVQLLSRDERSNARLATEAGYTDEAHLVRDFRALCGTTPSLLVP